jgi:excinuclease UvrABC nuclease subunit
VVDWVRRVLLSEREAWRVPVGPGVYVLYDGEQPIYVGKATSLRARFSDHARRSHNPQLARAVEEKEITFTYQRVFTGRELDDTERGLIRGLGPAFNRVRYRVEEGTRGSWVSSDRLRRE